MACRKLVLLALAVSSCLHLVSAFQPLPRPDHLAQTTTAESSARGDGASGRTCSYTVRIKTSCSSPPRTSDAVSLAFGDAYRNEVYAAGLAGPSSSSRAFERCATDTFRIGGPCGYGVCYLYLRRAGSVGWTPEWVRVYEPTSDTPSTFYYGDPLPDSVWYGFNRCPHLAGGPASSSPSSAAAAAAQAL